MSYLSLINIKHELLNFIRNSNVLSTTERGVTTTSEDFTATGGAETFTLTITTARNVRAVTDNGTALKFGTDYNFTYSATTGYITQVIVSKVLTLGHKIAVSFDYKATQGSAIYPDYPRQDLDLSSYPRIGFDLFMYDKSTAGFGNVNRSDLTFLIKILSGSTKSNDTYMDTLNQAVIAAQNNFYYLSYIKPTNITQNVPVSERGKNKIYEVSMRIMARNNYEIN